jgi:hypothetical protein
MLLVCWGVLVFAFLALPTHVLLVLLLLLLAGT